uniref:Glycerol kinase 5 n=1 Tax=Photinus pyralis TaxID=7054 RepID=A0A1Y1L423_PHOPY
MEDQFIASVDVGTSLIRCHILNCRGQTISSVSQKVNLLYPQPGYVEIDPEDLWNSVVCLIKAAVLEANVEYNNITLGISTQRGTFTIWRKDNGQPFHNFITWKDLRSDALVKQWEKSLILKGFRMGCYGIYLLTGNKRYLAGSKMKLANTQATMRLIWALKNVPKLKQAVENGNAMFGTVDTWLVYKLTGGRKHVTDITNVSATGLFDPFILNWSLMATHILRIPSSILPKIVSNDYSFGSTVKSIFGVSIPIKCVISDQSASMFGSCCYQMADTKITLGTGTFLDVNTGSSPLGCNNGLYPLVGWSINNKITYFVEGASNDTGSLIQWALSAGIIENPHDSGTLASSVESTDGVYFIPAFSGLGPPFMDDNAASGYIGLKVTSTKNHMIRALLESIVYRVTLLYKMMLKETNFKIRSIWVDGGVSNNDFVCQLLANILGIEVHRPSSTEMTVLGVSYITGLKIGMWKNESKLKKLRTLNCTFKPSRDITVYEECVKEFNVWLKAVDRFKLWYT